MHEPDGDVRTLGRSGLMVSRIGLGTMAFGYTADESTSCAIMDAAIDAGINYLDTADVYGGPQTADMAKGFGVSEEIIRRWLKRSGHRDDIVLATKVYQPMASGPNGRRLSAYHIRRACEASLRRLQTDHIDLDQMHHVDRYTHGRKSGRRWSNSCARARSPTSAAATSPRRTSPSPSRQHPRGTRRYLRALR